MPELTPVDRERDIDGLIWTFAVDGIILTREEAEAGMAWAEAHPLPPDYFDHA